MMKRLKNSDVISLAKMVAHSIGITGYNFTPLLNEFLKAIPKPAIIQKNNYTLWVDKYYIAYSNDDENTIRYAYIHKSHYNEEMKDIPIMLKKEISTQKHQMLKGIESQMLTAKKYMDKHETNIYISSKFSKHLWNLKENISV